MSNRITLKTILDHLQGFRNYAEERFDTMEKRFNAKIDDVKKDIGELNTKLERMNRNITFQLDAIANRVNDLEVAIVEQKHEQRIQRLERHAGFRK